MGQAVIKAAQAEGITVGARIVRDQTALESHIVKVNDYFTYEQLEQACSAFDILIDFTKPKVSLAALSVCCLQNKPVISGTTGFNSNEINRLKAFGEHIPLLWDANMSIGVHAYLELIKHAARLLPMTADVEIIEKHHSRKLDAPSGTALKMGEVVASEREQTLENSAVYDRHTDKQERQIGEIGFSSIRAGEIVGEHTIMLAESGEVIELTHRSYNRRAYATGAIEAAKWITDKTPRFYTMSDLANHVKKDD